MPKSANHLDSRQPVISTGQLIEIKASDARPRAANAMAEQLESSPVSASEKSRHANLDSIEASRSSETITLLLDLSGDERAAREWAAKIFQGAQIHPLKKSDLKWGSKREAVSRLRALAPHTFAAFAEDLDRQSLRGALMLFAAVAGARHIVMGDGAGRVISRSRAGVLLIEAPRFAFEMILGYGVIVPLSWLLTATLGAMIAFRGARFRLDHRKQRSTHRGAKQAAASQHATAAAPLKPRSSLYIKATLASAAEGGMASHIAGFARGARSLGHSLSFLLSGNASDGLARRLEISQPQSRGGFDVEKVEMKTIEPSTTFAATRALFELWNNFVFTAKSIDWIVSGSSARREFDFIYQRYSRFNWTGVALSLITGLPLALEFNGSEVWVSQRWDPVGQLRLLKRFERLNQRAADLIFAVSEVERRNLIDAGVDAARVVANPNGVDTDEFRPDCGGRDLRRRLGIEDRTVIGFLGTFGPWHGAPNLAEAARRANEAARCHFLFIGDGEQRAVTQEIIAGSRVDATFIGRAPHDQVRVYLDACDILVAPHVPAADGSEFFGSPTKLFEYMAMARPVIASRLGQMADVIADGENGLLVEPGDTDALARAIERLAGDEALRARLGDAARRAVTQRYTWRHNAARVFEAMEKLEAGD